MSKREKIHLRKIPEGFVPADRYAYSLLDSKKLCNGDVVGVTITKLRNPRFNRLVHKIGMLCAENIDDFNNMDAHAVIKRLQIESNAGCEEVAIRCNHDFSVNDMYRKILKELAVVLGFNLNDSDMLVLRTPKSLSFDSMDESEYHDVAKQICRHIAEKYWPSCTADEIEQMAQVSVNE